MMRLLLLVFLFFIFTPLITLAQARSSKLKPLYFQADRNKVQVLPQRFEYTFLDENRLKIGDILLDTSKITFKIEPSSKDSYRIIFTWPADLLKEGKLALKNNNGKAIFSTVLSPENIDLSPGAKDADTEDLRFEVATLTIENAPKDLIDEMKYLPFMQFCLYRESEETKIYLCSKELYLSSQEGPLAIKTRKPTRSSSQIEINGKVVGNQGLIYLNSSGENVVFKAEIRTGAFLELETRMKAVDFKDIIASTEGDSFVLTASGARPVDERSVKSISDKEWQVTLPRARPVLFLRGDGDIPMRQELYIRGRLPKEKNRAFLSSRSLSRTYSSRLALSGIAPADIAVKIPPGVKNSKIEQQKKNQFVWTIENLPKGRESRHYLLLSTKNDEFVAGYDVFRGEPFSLSLSSLFLSPSGMFYANIDFRWWIENFLSQYSPWANFRWGLGLERQQVLSANEDVAKVNLTTAQLMWRAQDGYQMVDETWGLSLPFQNIESDGTSSLGFGLGAFLEKKPSRWLRPLMQWTSLGMEYITPNSALRVKALGFWALSPQLHLRYGIEVRQLKSTQTGLEAGVFWKF